MPNIQSGLFHLPPPVPSCWKTGGNIMDTGYKFQVRWDGRVVVGVTKVGALKRSTEVIEHREGGDPSTSRKSPGLTKFQPIVLKRGVTHDPEFENWPTWYISLVRLWVQKCL